MHKNRELYWILCLTVIAMLIIGSMVFKRIQKNRAKSQQASTRNKNTNKTADPIINKDSRDIEVSRAKKEALAIEIARAEEAARIKKAAIAKELTRAEEEARIKKAAIAKELAKAKEEALAVEWASAEKSARAAELAIAEDKARAEELARTEKIEHEKEAARKEVAARAEELAIAAEKVRAEEVARAEKIEREKEAARKEAAARAAKADAVAAKQTATLVIESTNSATMVEEDYPLPATQSVEETLKGVIFYWDPVDHDTDYMKQLIYAVKLYDNTFTNISLHVVEESTDHYLAICDRDKPYNSSLLSFKFKDKKIVWVSEQTSAQRLTTKILQAKAFSKPLFNGYFVAVVDQSASDEKSFTLYQMDNQKWSVLLHLENNAKHSNTQLFNAGEYSIIYADKNNDGYIDIKILGILDPLTEANSDNSSVQPLATRDFKQVFYWQPAKHQFIEDESQRIGFN